MATGVAKITGHAGREPAKVDTAMPSRTVTIPVDQLDSFARALRRLEAARYALVGIGADKEINVWPVEELILDTQGELHAVLIALDPAHAEVSR